MDSFISSVLQQMGIYIALIVGILFVLNFMTKGFLFTWFKVKSSRDKKILVKLRNLIHDFYVTGFIADGMITFKGSNKKERIISLPNGSVYRTMGVFCVDIDEEKNCVNDRDYTKVRGFDGEKNKSLHLRALYAPTLDDMTTKIIVVVVIVILIVVIVDIILANSNKNAILSAIESLKPLLVQNKTTAITGSGIVGGGV